jgi:ubiquinone/menaquinone biosynthesis C-methylase UbiE
VNKVTQDDIFLNDEGNRWYERNRSHLGSADMRKDLICRLLGLYGIVPKIVLEVGASDGYRLAFLREQFGCEVHGAEPSQEAIDEGSKKYPQVHFQKATAATMVYPQEYFDLIILNFVLHWVDRGTLLRSIATVDSCLKTGGYLILGDFQVPHFMKRQYHHLPAGEVFTYKMMYKNIFLSTGLYQEVAFMSFDHDRHTMTGDIFLDACAAISLLRKADIYLEKQ